MIVIMPKNINKGPQQNHGITFTNFLSSCLHCVSDGTGNICKFSFKIFANNSFKNICKKARIARHKQFL